MTISATITALKAEWHRICRAMNEGYWRGTEAQAVARIEKIKAAIAKLEDGK
jgi:hypothetical protein